MAWTAAAGDSDGLKRTDFGRESLSETISDRGLCVSSRSITVALAGEIPMAMREYRAARTGAGERGLHSSHEFVPMRWVDAFQRHA